MICTTNPEIAQAYLDAGGVVKADWAGRRVTVNGLSLGRDCWVVRWSHPDYPGANWNDLDGDEEFLLYAMEESELTQQENTLLLTLCREAGDIGTDEEVVDGSRGNHHPDDIRLATLGNVPALVRLRQAFGLPIFT